MLELLLTCHSKPINTMDLQDLPNEVLTKIFTQLVGTHAHHPRMGTWFGCELSTLSRFFSDLIRPIIYQTKITISFPNSGNAFRCSLLLRSLKENPEIAPLVAEVELWWEDTVDQDSAVEIANQLLATLPNLRTLVIQTLYTKMEF